MFDGVPILDLSSSAILGITVILILTGRIVPKHTCDNLREEVKSWREAYEKEREARLQLQNQNGLLLETARTSSAVLNALGHEGNFFPKPEEAGDRHEDV